MKAKEEQDNYDILENVSEISPDTIKAIDIDEALQEAKDMGVIVSESDGLGHKIRDKDGKWKTLDLEEAFKVFKNL